MSFFQNSQFLEYVPIITGIKKNASSYYFDVRNTDSRIVEWYQNTGYTESPHFPLFPESLFRVQKESTLFLAIDGGVIWNSASFPQLSVDLVDFLKRLFGRLVLIAPKKKM